MPKRLSEKTTKRLEKVKSDRKPLLLKNKFKRVIFSPTFNVMTLVLLLLCVLGGLRVLSARRTIGQVKFIEQTTPPTNVSTDNQERVYNSPEIFHGEVYDTSIRLREAGALGMAISLVVFSSGAEQGTVPPNLEKIWSLLSEQKLMPPGLELKNGELLSPFGKIIVRYQSMPLRFEILSFPGQGVKSPAIILRFPLNRLDGRTITYFQSTSVNSQDIPPPFVPFEKIVSAGWTLAQWRGEILPKVENQEQILQAEKAYLEQMQIKK